MKNVDKDDDTELVYVRKILEKLLAAHSGCAAVRMLWEEGYDLCMPIYEGSYVTNIRDICLKYVWYDLEELIPKMQEMGVDINEALAGGCTPVFLFVDALRSVSNEQLYKKAVNVLHFFSTESMEQLNNEGLTAVHMAAQLEKNTLILEYMIQSGVDVNVTTDAPQVAGNTPLHLACVRNNIKAAILLKENGADDSVMNIEDETPAYCIFENERYYNHQNAYKILESLEDVDTPKAETGETPILHMLRKNYSGVKEMTALFLAKGVKINAADNYGNTPLLMHTERGCDREVIKLLLRAGADISARNRDGNNVLFFALEHGDCELARFLIKKGADYNICNHKGQTPAVIAVEKGFDAVLELMTDITVFPRSDESEAEFDYDDYDDEDEDLDDDKPDGKITYRQYTEMLKMYVGMYGENKGKQLADIIVRITEINQNGITQDNMEEYTQLTAAFQAIIQS